MADRGLLAITQLAAFTFYLRDRGEVLLPAKVNAMEVLRWRGTPGKAMPIIFDRQDGGKHLSANDAAIPYIRQFIAHKRTS